MKVHRELTGLLPVVKKAVVTIGTFDGVHLGHRQIIAQMKKEAAIIGGETVIITFDPHPRKIISSVPEDVKLLNTLEEKIILLEAAGIDHLVVVPFNQQFANQTADEYIHDFLFNTFHPHTVIIGYDHRFGKGRVGDFHLLKAFGVKLGFEVKEISEQMMNEIVISSTRIRLALLETDIVVANKFLGYPYFFEGTVVEGNKLGRTIGYPTANLHITSEEKLVPGNGVYAVTVRSLELGLGSFGVDWKDKNDNNFKNIESFPLKQLKGMMNIGYRPTVDGRKRVIEVNIFDFAKEIYGEVLQVFVHAYIRREVKFDGMDALKIQLEKDQHTAKTLLQNK